MQAQPQAPVYLAYTTQDQPLTAGWTLPHQLAIKPVLIATLTDSFVGVKMAVNVNEGSGLSDPRGATPCFCSCAGPALAEGLQRCCQASQDPFKPSVEYSRLLSRIRSWKPLRISPSSLSYSSDPFVITNEICLHSCLLI